MAGSCLLYCRLMCCRTGGKRGGGFILFSLYAEVVSDGRKCGVMGSHFINCTLRLCREGGGGRMGSRWLYCRLRLCWLGGGDGGSVLASLQAELV